VMDLNFKLCVHATQKHGTPTAQRLFQAPHLSLGLPESRRGSFTSPISLAAAAARSGGARGRVYV
jgi:hypothetical protein